MINGKRYPEACRACRAVDLARYVQTIACRLGAKGDRKRSDALWSRSARLVRFADSIAHN